MNLEEVLQKDLDQDTFEKVVTSIKGLKRLSSLNSDLILLAKIENMQFPATEEITINDLIKRKIEEFDRGT